MFYSRWAPRVLCFTLFPICGRKDWGKRTHLIAETCTLIYSQFISNLLIKYTEIKEELLCVTLIITLPFPAVLLFINNNMFTYSSFHLRMLAATCSEHWSWRAYRMPPITFSSGEEERKWWIQVFLLLPDLGVGAVLFLKPYIVKRLFHCWQVNAKTEENQYDLRIFVSFLLNLNGNGWFTSSG